MSRELLQYYERELGWLKQAGSDFAAAHPGVAGNLGLHDGIVEDPHISRLIESVALLNARIQQQLDSDFPQISDALLEHLYPQHLAPIPTVTVVEIIANEGDQVQTIAAQSAICTPPVDGVSCQFRTVFPVTLLPLQLHSAQLQSQPLSTPGAATARSAVAVLVLRLRANDSDFSFAGCGADKLRLFLRGEQHAWPLYDLLTGHCAQITIASDALHQAPVTMATSCLCAAGFEADEDLLPILQPTPQPCHHLLEFFHFPQKFLFIDLHGLAAATVHMRGNLSVYLYLDISNRELERHVDAESFSLTATPAVNLFRQVAEPLSLGAGSFEYPLTADARNRDSYEIYAISQVTHIDEISGEHTPVPPFFGSTHDDPNVRQFWHHRRELTQRGHRNDDIGFDSFIAFSDIACNTTPPRRAVVHTELLCSNRNLPVRLAAGRAEFRLRNDSGRVQRIRALLPMTPPLRRATGNGARWRLLSHLSHSLCGLSGASDPGDTLREILTLHAAEDSTPAHALIAAIDHVQLDPVMLPLRHHGRVAMCRGIDICITFNDSRLAGTSLMLYATILEHFLAQSVSINAFVRLSIRRKGQSDIVRRGPARAGTRPLL